MISNNDKTGRKSKISNNILIVGLALLVVFLIITGLVISDTSQNFDASVALAINSMKIGPGLNLLMILASEYGRAYFWVPIVAIMLIFGKRDTKMLAVELAILFIVGIAVGLAMKYVMYRPRPFYTLSSIVTRVPRDTDSSYPSGHALIVAIGAIFALYKFRRKGIALLLGVEAAVVCYSRVYVGVHYPLDVISGIILAGAITFISLFVLERYLQKFVDWSTGLAQKITRLKLFSL